MALGLAATSVAFVIGGLWYSPAVFGRQWMALNKLINGSYLAITLAAIGGVLGLFAR